MEEKICQLIGEILDLDPSTVTPGSELKELAEDSLDQIELILAVENKYLIDIPDEDIDNLVTVQDLVNYVEKFGKKDAK